MRSSFRELFIWQASVDLAADIIDLTNNFPREQRWVLIEQMQRSAVSVASNIAEGKGRLSHRELRQFLAIARGSLFELDTQIEIAFRLHLVDAERKAQLSDRIGKIGAGISNFLRHLKPRLSTSPPQHPNS